MLVAKKGLCGIGREIRWNGSGVGGGGGGLGNKKEQGQRAKVKKEKKIISRFNVSLFFSPLQ